MRQTGRNTVIFWKANSILSGNPLGVAGQALIPMKYCEPIPQRPDFRYRSASCGKLYQPILAVSCHAVLIELEYYNQRRWHDADTPLGSHLPKLQ